jgi:predicted RNase H-like nuclease (RuvC/YqgF family)
MNKIVDLAEQNLAQLLLERDVLRADVERLGAIVSQLESKLASLAPPCHLGCRHDHFENRERMRVDHIGRLIEERNEAWKELARRRAGANSK